MTVNAGPPPTPEDGHPESAPYSDPALLDRKMQKTRALVTSCCLVIGCLAYLSGAVQGHAGKVLPAIALMPLSSCLAWKALGTRKWKPAGVTAATLALDTLIASWVIAWTGGRSSPCLPFYLTPVMAASFRFGPRGSVGCAALALAGCLLAGVPAGGPSPGPAGAAATPELILRIVILFAASGFGIGALHRKLGLYRRERALRRELEEANQDLARAYRDLQETQEQLLHAETLASLGRLVAGVAHEINNPISFVYGNLIHLESYLANLKSLLAFDEELPLPQEERRQREALKTSLDYDYLCRDLERALGDCRKGADRVRRIVDSLLGFSRVGKGACRKVQLAEPLEHALSILAGRLKQGVRIVRRIDPEAAVAGDADELGQLFLNLLANAADAVGPGGSIRVGAVGEPRGEDRPGVVVVAFEDDGPGIPEAVRGRIFEPFFTTKEVGKGTGLGLSIAYGIVKRHRGEIAVHCPASGGTCFRVQLPAWRTPAGEDWPGR